VTRISSRGVRRLSAAVGSLLILVGCGGGSSGSGSGSPSSAGPDIKIGILAPYTGVYAAFGPKVIEDPVNLYLSQHGGKIGGRKVTLLKADDESTPAGEARAARQLVEQDQVNVVIGLVNSAGALAVRDYLHNNKVPTILTVAGAAELTTTRKSPYIFRTGFASGQIDTAGAVLAAKGLNVRSTAAIGDNYVAVTQIFDSLLGGMKELGITVTKQVMAPFPTTDYGPYLSQIKPVASSVDVITPMMFGADSITFFNQYKQGGFTTPLYTNGDVTEQSLFLDTVGEAAIGGRTYWVYSPWLDFKENNTFRSAYLAKFNRLPGAFSMTAYLAMLFLDAAATKLNGDITDPDKLITTMAAAKVSSPIGPMQFNANHGLDFPVYLNKIVKVTGGGQSIVSQVPMGAYIANTHQGGTVAEAMAAYHATGAPVSEAMKKVVASG
jgi:branched-chain amino acid transport system substrate-binding protein